MTRYFRVWDKAYSLWWTTASLGNMGLRGIGGVPDEASASVFNTEEHTDVLRLTDAGDDWDEYLFALFEETT